MMDRPVKLLGAILALAVSAGTATAAPIAFGSAISIDGAVTMQPDNVTTATGLDFMKNGTIAGASDGSLTVGGVPAGSFSIFSTAACAALSSGGCGTIKDLTTGTLPLTLAPN